MSAQPKSKTETKHFNDPKEVLRSFEANEFIIGIIGYVGSGISFVAEKFRSLLLSEGFDDVIIIKASVTIKEWAKNNDISFNIESDPIGKVVEMQTLGDDMRKNSNEAAVAQGVICEIMKQRALWNGVENYDNNQEVLPNPEKKRAYIIDSIKHPAEVELLRQVYGDTFSLIGVVCYDDIRAKRISKKHFSTIEHAERNDVQSLMERDAHDALKPHGQHVTDAFWESDYFVDNTPDEDSGELFILNDELGRFIDIITYNKIIRPTSSETGMHIAYSAKVRSACLSRQVGASILDDDGNILATGTNEVPKAGGGIYGEGFNEVEDHRCFNCGKCSSNDEQNKIIERLIVKFPNIQENSKDNNDLIKSLRKIGLGSILEFSRAIHAEMESITSAARRGISIKGAKMFVTTYPCHYCARHIVASGISEVQFIEPYPKSLALTLHEDTITIDAQKAMEENKVLFKPFVGVAPRFYEKAFVKDRELKDNITGKLKICKPIWQRKWNIYSLSYTKLEVELTKYRGNDGL